MKSANKRTKLGNVFLVNLLAPGTQMMTVFIFSNFDFPFDVLEFFV